MTAFDFFTGVSAEAFADIGLRFAGIFFCSIFCLSIIIVTKNEDIKKGYKAGNFCENTQPVEGGFPPHSI
jgi:hypothetical protein